MARECIGTAAVDERRICSAVRRHHRPTVDRDRIDRTFGAGSTHSGRRPGEAPPLIRAAHAASPGGFVATCSRILGARIQNPGTAAGAEQNGQEHEATGAPTRRARRRSDFIPHHPHPLESRHHPETLIGRNPDLHRKRRHLGASCSWPRPSLRRRRQLEHPHPRPLRHRPKALPRRNYPLLPRDFRRRPRTARPRPRSRLRPKQCSLRTERPRSRPPLGRCSRSNRVRGVDSAHTRRVGLSPRGRRVVPPHDDCEPSPSS